jgi:alpha,alpha-trehalase
MTHQVQVEYGNVGTDFKYVPREGFGWMNASFQIGLGLISKKMRRALGTCTNPDLFFEKALKGTITATPEEIERRLQRRKHCCNYLLPLHQKIRLVYTYFPFYIYLCLIN